MLDARICSRAQPARARVASSCAASPPGRMRVSTASLFRTQCDSTIVTECVRLFGRAKRGRERSGKKSVCSKPTRGVKAHTRSHATTEFVSRPRSSVGRGRAPLSLRATPKAMAASTAPRTGMPNLNDQRIDLKAYRASVCVWATSPELMLPRLASVCK